MITINNHLGTITYSKQFFYSLIGGTVTNCFGIVGMNAGDAKQTFVEKVPLKFIKKFAEKTILSEKGVTVRYKNDKLYIDLHISVMYGVNVSVLTDISDCRKSLFFQKSACSQSLTPNPFPVGRGYITGATAPCPSKDACSQPHKATARCSGTNG